jgi:hypothetical protein
MLGFRPIEPRRTGSFAGALLSDCPCLAGASALRRPDGRRLGEIVDGNHRIGNLTRSSVCGGIPFSVAHWRRRHLGVQRKASSASKREHPNAATQLPAVTKAGQQVHLYCLTDIN